MILSVIELHVAQTGQIYLNYDTNVWEKETWGMLLREPKSWSPINLEL